MKNEDVTSLKRVLIIDDELEIGLLMKRILRKKFDIVEHANTLQQALDSYQELQPNIILLDNNLPDGSGIERIGEFKAMYPNACIIVVSAMTHLRNQAMDNGAFAFIAKPLSFKNIFETINSTCI